MAICHPLFHYKLRDRRKVISICCTAAIWLIGLIVSIDDAVNVHLSLSIDDISKIEKLGLDAAAEDHLEGVSYLLVWLVPILFNQSTASSSVKHFQSFTWSM